MALPHMPSHFTTRKNIYEQAIVNRRTKEHDFREKWGTTANYFQKENIAALKKTNWESKESFQNSMDVYRTNKNKEEKANNLARRRARLAEILNSDREQQKTELKGLSGVSPRLLEDMRGKCEGLKSAREDKRKQLAEDLLYEHWRTNNPDIRKLETKQHEKHVIDTWTGQVEDKQERAAQARQELENLEQQLEEERQAALEQEQLQEESRIQKEKELKGVLRRQVEELKRREAETKELKRKEDQLETAQQELEMMEYERRQKEQQRKKMEFGRVLLRQHATALKRKSKQIQEELEEDRQFLEVLAQQETQDHAIMSARKERAAADASWMKKVIEEQLRVEVGREAELDMLYQDEAAKIWTQRENEWAKERLAREKLMKQVLEDRQEQIHGKMELVREMQEESLQQREELLQELEMANQYTKREQDEHEQAKVLRKEEIAAQLTARQEKADEAKRQLQQELALDLKAEEDYDDLLSKEAEQLHIRGFQPKGFARKTAWM